jgi:hypothetical protein
MKLTEAIDGIEEARGSKEGRKTFTSKKGATRDVKKSVKSRVRVFPSIKAALSNANYGQIFSTKAAGRLYVVSKGKWGAKSGRGKIAKGFTKGSATPSADWGSVKKHAARTMLRHGKASDKLAQKYGSRSIKKERGLKYK